MSTFFLRFDRANRVARAPLAFVATVLLTPWTSARAQDSLEVRARYDSVAPASAQTRETFLSRRDVVAFAGAALATTALAPLDGTIQHAMQAEDIHGNHGLRGTASVLAFVGGPGPFVGGGVLYAVGRAANAPRFATLGVTLTEGVIVAAALNGLVKGFSGRELPNATKVDPGDFSFGRGFHDGNGKFVSFPSGHTAASFAAATVVAEEVKSWNPSAAHIVTPTAYGVATLVAVSRLYQNLHWASDLPLGAVIGVWSGKTVVKWQRHHPDNWLLRQLLGVAIIPEHGRLTIMQSRMP